MSEITCRIMRGDNAVFSCNERGIAPLVSLFESGTDVNGCVAYDKIVGRAAAFLYVLMGVKEVHAGVLSDGAAEVFRRYGIAFDCQTATKRIVNRNGDGPCPMEQAVEKTEEPQEAFFAVKKKLKSLRSRPDVREEAVFPPQKN